MSKAPCHAERSGEESEANLITESKHPYNLPRSVRLEDFDLQSAAGLRNEIKSEAMQPKGKTQNEPPAAPI